VLALLTAAPVASRAVGTGTAPDLAAQVDRTEAARGLRFVRRPTLEVLGAGDARLAELRRAAAARRPLPPTGSAPAAPGPERCFAVFERAQVLCLAPFEEDELRLALARLLDAQAYPALVAAAPALPGDPGIALRSLLAASAAASADAGFPPPPAAPVPGVLGQETIEIPPGESPDRILAFAASLFLAVQPDREQPFRAPPLSTKQILGPPAYRAGERPRLLAGPPLALAGCRPTEDQSVGLGRLLAGLAEGGGRVGGRLLAAWKGDRLLRFACDDAREPWLYVVELADEAAADDFAAGAEALLPRALARPATRERVGRRAVFSNGIETEAARRFAAGLEARELRCLEALPCAE